MLDNQWLREPGIGRIRRAIRYGGFLIALVFFGSCVWTLTPRSWSTGETRPQMLTRMEKTYGLGFPTNMQVLSSKAWWERSPRTSDRRYTAVQMRCDPASWLALRNTFGTNFYGGTFVEPHGRNLHSQVQWISIVNSTWDHYSGKFRTRDVKDNWLRIHFCDVYFAPPVGTNQDVVVLVWDTRSEINW